MEISVNGSPHECEAIQTMTCPAGTAYWRLQVTKSGEHGALYSEHVGPIYGDPDLAGFSRRAQAILTARGFTPDLTSRRHPNVKTQAWLAKVSHVGDVVAYGPVAIEALAYLANMVGATHYQDMRADSNQIGRLITPHEVLYVAALVPFIDAIPV